MIPRRVFIDGFAVWPGPQGARPSPALLNPNERRRAPMSVLMALHVAEAAAAQSGLDLRTLASVFTSAHGDLEIVDALCSTLEAEPLLLSPTRFHHSVHNAASGYWAMASGSRQASTAVSAFDCSFAAGWLEAGCQCAADRRPVLLAGYDTAAAGPLASVNRSRGEFALALVLNPREGPRSIWAVDWSLNTGPASEAGPTTHPMAGNAMADALPLAEALGAGQDASLALPLSAGLHLRLALQRLAPGRAGAAAAS